MELERAFVEIRAYAEAAGVPEHVVVNAIEGAMSDLLREAYLNNDVDQIQRWKRIPCKGPFPDACEFVAYLFE